MDKVKKGGKVAIIYSPGFGGGWSTWSNGSNEQERLFDPDIVNALLKGESRQAIQAIADKNYPEDCNSVKDLTVKWLEEGTLFRVHEYDGSESIEVMVDLSWIQA